MERLERKYHLQMEMASGAYVTAILTMADQKAGIGALGKLFVNWINLSKSFHSGKEQKKLFSERKNILKKKNLLQKKLNLNY